MNKFDDTALEVDSKKIEILVQNKTSVKLLMHDTAGQERFRTLTSSYFRNADGVLVVYDLSQRSSFDDLEDLFYEGSRYCERAMKFLIANKLDLQQERVVKTEEGRHQSEQLGASHFFEVSAKTNENVEELVQTVAYELLQRKNQESRETFDDMTSDQVFIQPQNQNQPQMRQTENNKKCC
eukprot:CAMPEP_0201507564 /NCGR_PEP_ID=MMETSP0161_2-20130828/1207_1 /ASSEMBLY_ACC=CAM_ASM_000251 /TAXON_ID=180227 /ORGANISM="Neoparamoeba aestuarina, Strain SoJaBio B1-5/56/2" /LENGTH=180 /DNA_ID=CAMNT_0047901973 /DNA_START=175 /DNA_END=717 /DNA_ORIENTATION=+